MTLVLCYIHISVSIELSPSVCLSFSLEVEGLPPPMKRHYCNDTFSLIVVLSNNL